MSLRQQLAALADADVDAIEALLASSEQSIAYILTCAMSLAESRPALSFRVLASLARRPEPSEANEREHWLRAHNNACFFAAQLGSAADQRDIVERALRVAPDNVAIYHNAACVLCQLGEAEAALEAVAHALAHADEATARAIADDTDLDLIRKDDRFQRLIAGHGEFEPPAWASGWTAWEVIQFREHLRSTLSEPDMSEFDAGRIRGHGRTIEIVELAQRCRAHPIPEWAGIVHMHLVDALSD